MNSLNINKQHSDRLLIHNANLLSFHADFAPGSADAIAINAGRIEAVGRYEELQRLDLSNREIIDAGGRTLMPGFNDSHIHIWKVGNLKTSMLDLRGVGSCDEMLQRLTDYIAANPQLDWITARGFNEVDWQAARLPTRADLDRVSKVKPIYLIRTCAHIGICNSSALARANITAETVVPPGGIIQLGDDGRPNGILAENALALITNNIPAPSQEDLKLMVWAARAELYRYGITAATDPGVGSLLMSVYIEMNAQAELGFRLNAMPFIETDGIGITNFDQQKFAGDFLNINTIKLFADGGLSGKTAALKRPYRNSRERGLLRLSGQHFLSICRAAIERGFGVATHAIGDAAIEEVLQVYSQLDRSAPELIKRIEHLGLPEPAQLQTMGEHSIACSMQTVFINELGKNFIQYLDAQYLNQCYPVRSVLNCGILIALSSDAPVVRDLNPFVGMMAAITRRSSEGVLIAPSESISITEALRAYTLSAAEISGTPQSGSLEPGKFADLIILDRDPLTTAPTALAEIRVLNTIVAGKQVWAAGPV